MPLRAKTFYITLHFNFFHGGGGSSRQSSIRSQRCKMSGRSSEGVARIYKSRVKALKQIKRVQLHSPQPPYFLFFSSVFVKRLPPLEHEKRVPQNLPSHCQNCNGFFLMPTHHARVLFLVSF